jgi:hypothetical protein
MSRLARARATLREIEYGTVGEISDGKTSHRLKIVGGSDGPSR